MDIKKTITKLLSPETYTERVVFIALGIYCIDRALFFLANSYNTYLRISLAIFSIAVGVVVLVKFGRKFKVNALRIGLFGLGLWLIADGVFNTIFFIRDLNIIRVTFSFGVGTALMIGGIKRGSAEKEMGLFLLGLHIVLIAVSQMIIVYDIVDYSGYYKFYRFVIPVLLFVAGTLVIVRQSEEKIVNDDIQNDITDIK